MARRYLTLDEKQRIQKRAHNRCEYCQSLSSFSSQSFVVEHIIPLVKGGSSSLSNLAFACGGCNGHKYTKLDAIDPVSRQKASLFHPRHDEWESHFRWSEDFTEIIGITPTGRATVGALKMNRPGLLNLRKLLREAGKHPLYTSQ